MGVGWGLGLQQYTSVPVHRVHIFFATIRILYIEQAITIVTIHICINKHGKALSSVSAHPP